MKQHIDIRHAFLLILFSLLLQTGCATQPAASNDQNSVAHSVISVETTTGRAVPVRAIYPTDSEPDPVGVILFSHGAFSDYDLYDRVTDAWAESGFLILAIRHIDSPQNPLNKSYGQEQQWKLRLEDMRTTTDELDNIIAMLPQLTRKVETERLIMSGHSYGAITAMAVAGAVTTDMSTKAKIRVVNPGVRAVIAMSPPGLIPGYIEQDTFNQMTTPLLLQTGTADVLENFIPKWEMHKAAYELSPAGHKWLTVGTDVDHYFGGLTGRFNLENATPTPEALDSFISLSKLFLSAYANDDSKSAFLLKRKAESGSWSDNMTLETR